jgi:hypothetical protein
MGRSLLLALRDVSCGESRFMSGKITANAGREIFTLILARNAVARDRWQQLGRASLESILRHPLLS